MITGKEIREWRSRTGVSRCQLAKELGVHLRTIVRWELGKNVPQGASQIALKRTMTRLGQPRVASRFCRLGLCFEFLDTSLPVLSTITAPPLNDTLGPVVALPIPWSMQSLYALKNSMVDVILFNEYCAWDFMHEACTRLIMSDDRFVSGPFYVAMSLPETVCACIRSEGPEREEELLRFLWDHRTIRIVTTPDAQVCLTMVRDACIQQGGILGEYAQNADMGTSVQLVPHFAAYTMLDPTSWYGDAVVAYVGGQDQRSLLERAPSSGGRTVEFVTEFENLVGLRFPEELRTNRLMAIDGYGGNAMLSSVEERIDSARSLVQKSAGSIRTNVEIELIRWQYLHRSGSFVPTRQWTDARHEWDLITSRICDLSAEASRWMSMS